MRFSGWDAEMAQLAARQGGFVSRSQLLDRGMPVRQIEHRIATGRLIRVYQGVYAVGHIPTRPEARANGALLACGPRSALSHSSAASVWGIVTYWKEPFELTLANDRRPKGVTIHHSSKLLTRDVTTRLGLRVTSTARTALDLAPAQTERRRTRMVNDLRFRKLLSLPALDDVLTRNPHHAGYEPLLKLLEESQQEPTRSELEDAFQAMVRKHHLPIPSINVPVSKYRVDALYGEYDPATDSNTQCLIVELDGWGTHKTKTAFARDRRQDSDLLAGFGIPTVRLTHFQTTEDAQATAEQLRTLLRQRSLERWECPADDRIAH